MSASIEMPVLKDMFDENGLARDAHSADVQPIYLDYSATTPVDPRVAAKMIPYISEHFGNPASRRHSSTCRNY